MRRDDGGADRRGGLRVLVSMEDGRTRGYISMTYPSIDILVVDARTSTSLSTTFNFLSPLLHNLYFGHRRTSSLLSKYRIRRKRRNTRTASR